MILKNYIDLDAYSQRNHPGFSAYSFKTSRNMGKHDLWRSVVTVAATASLLNLTLVTTDGDFDHLHGTFLNLQKIVPATLLALLQ
ncbi:hypothetical protein [Spirosoma spitsbergense]|uniref:hypothetical protein n=1 Tax=Spirosoma spitsbergense TaxID=431554 RepID=UPI0012F98049|nr:hypothetical protein [Spirosoma spitsbergense]